MKKLSLWLFLAFALLSLAAAETEPGDYRIGVEKIESPGSGQVILKSTPAFAILSVDGVLVGTGTWSGNVSPGIHAVNAEAKNHFPLVFLISVAEHAKYTIDIELKPHKGFLALSIDPVDADVYVDGKRQEGRFIELPVGRRGVLVKKFGYDEELVFMDILWNVTSSLAVALEPSEFKVTGFRLSPLAFDPLNRGLYGRARLSFSVAAPGKGRVEIFDAAGNLVYGSELPEFATWYQRFIWKGEDNEGRTVPDGSYTLVLSVWPRDGGTSISQAHPLELSRKIALDPNRMIKPMGFSGGRAGLVLFPEPDLGNILPGTFSILVFHPDEFFLDVGFRIGERIGLGLSAFSAPGGEGAATGVTLDYARKAMGFNGAVSLVYAHSSIDSLMSPGIGARTRLEFPFSVSLPARDGVFRLGASPGLSYHIDDARFGASLGLGLWYENRETVAGISAFQSLDGRGIMNSFNPLRLAAEGGFLFASLPFTLRGLVCASFDPGISKIGVGLGVGVVW